MRQCRPWLLLIGSGLAALAQPLQRETYSILMAGNAAGKSVQTRGADGAIEIEYSFNDRGRGPEVRGRYRFDSQGYPVAVDLRGHDYYKSEVDEHLTFAMAKPDGGARAKRGKPPARHST